jgi:hypothetical protein
VHHLPPAALVGRLADPGAPEVDRVDKAARHETGRGRGAGPVGGTEHERGRLAGAKREAGVRGPVVDGAGTVRLQPQRRPIRAARGKANVAVAGLDRVLGPPVVEAWLANPLEFDLAAHAFGPADDRGAVSVTVGDGHEIRHLSQPGGVERPRQQHVGVRQVQLLAGGAVEARTEREPAAPPVIEKRSEDCGRVEVRVRQEVDRAIAPDEGHRVEVADQPVVLDRLVWLVAAHRTRRATMNQAAPASEVSRRRWFHSVHCLR